MRVEGSRRYRLSFCVVKAELKSIIRRLISEQAKIPSSINELGDHDDLYDLGMTSHSSVMLMLGLENEFGVEFPDTMLTRDVFANVNSIESAISSLEQELN